METANLLPNLRDFDVAPCRAGFIRPRADKFAPTWVADASHAFRLLIASVLLMIATLAQAADEVVAGKVGYISGTLVAQRADGTVKVIGPKSEVLAGDMLITAKDSYAQVQMNDGAQMTLRPNSNLRIDAFQFRKEEPQADNVVLSLLKGGFRTLTGLIGKRGNADAYKVRAASATIGIRGTDYSARLCAAQNCRDDEAETPAKTTRHAVASPVIGRVMLVQGNLSAKDGGGTERKLEVGGPVYQGDTLTTGKGAYAIVAFRDESRVTLQSNTVFQVEQFKYDKAAAQENAVLRLLKGGVRVITGLIGRANHDNYQLRMSTATIGIRGTGFDAWCNGPCAKDAGNPAATTGGSLDGASLRKSLWLQYAEAATGDRLNDAGMQTSAWAQYAEAPAGDPLDGAGVYVWAGKVVLVSPGGSVTVALQQAAIIAHDTGLPVRLIAIPQAIMDNTTPRPDGIPLDMKKLFDTESNAGDPGLYVIVHDGHVILAKGDEKLDLGRGETGFADREVLRRLTAPPAFMDGDMQQINAPSGGNSGNPSMNGGACVTLPP